VLGAFEPALALAVLPATPIMPAVPVPAAREPAAVEPAIEPLPLAAVEG
jgi:hypothetical protein